MPLSAIRNKDNIDKKLSIISCHSAEKIWFILIENWFIDQCDCD